MSESAVERSGEVDEVPLTEEGTTEAVDVRRLKIAVVAFAAGATTFFVASALFTGSGTPPSTTPLISTSGHTLWFLGVAFLAIGAVAVLVSVGSLREGITGYLAAGTLGLGALTGLQWALVSYVDVLAARHEGYELLLDTVISPFGAGYAIAYGVLLGGGVAFLGWGLRRSRITHRLVGWAGVALGIVTVVGMGAHLVLANAPDTMAYNLTILLLPLVHVWAIVFAVDVYRRLE